MRDAGLAGPSTMKPDLACSKIDAVKVAGSSAEVFLTCFSVEDNVMRGLQTTRDIATTMTEWLDEIVADKRSYPEASQCIQLSLYDFMPRAWVDALMCLTKAQGFAPELLHQSRMSNLSFLEHHATKLRAKGPDEENAIMSDIAVVLGNKASPKNSTMERMLKRLCTKHPMSLNKSMGKVSCGNGTIKGVRTALEKCSMAMITS